MRLLREVVRLVGDPEVEAEPASGPARPSAEHAAGAVREPDRLLAVRVDHSLEQGRQVRRVLDQGDEGAEDLLRAVDAVARVRGLLAEVEREQEPREEGRRLAVLPRLHVRDLERCPAPVRATAEPAVQDEPLLLGEHEPGVPGQLDGARPERVDGSGRDDLEAGRAHHSRLWTLPQLGARLQARCSGPW